LFLQAKAEAPQLLRRAFDGRLTQFAVDLLPLRHRQGGAIDKGYVRLDEKLTEIIPEAFDGNADPLAGNITHGSRLLYGLGESPHRPLRSHDGSSELFCAVFLGVT
jgi:hypothetical protein